jgi:hypothetical protein
MKAVFCIVALVLCAGVKAFSQNPDSSRYIEVIYMKSTSPDFEKLQTETWKPINKQLIVDGKRSGWYFYKVKYPQGAKAEYEYVVVSASREWNLLTPSASDVITAIKKANIDLTLESIIKSTSEKRILVWTQLFRMQGMAVGHEAKPSKYLIANEVKAVPGQEGEYVKMEQTYFKPFHTARAAEGIMNNWGLYKREMPYGEKFASDYVTFNGYATWEDITKQNPPTAWKTAHGNLNFNEVHEKILSKRQTVNVECWELLDYAVK